MPSAIDTVASRKFIDVFDQYAMNFMVGCILLILSKIQFCRRENTLKRWKFQSDCRPSSFALKISKHCFEVQLLLDHRVYNLRYILPFGYLLTSSLQTGPPDMEYLVQTSNIYHA